MGASLFAIGATVIYKTLSSSKDYNTPLLEPSNINSNTSELAVMPGTQLFQYLKLQPMVESCRDRMGFDSSVFQKDCLSVLHQVADWVQLLPASESHHHAQPGGLLVHMIETTHFALRIRQGYLLPVGAAPEEIPARKHRWTYGVFISALLHDIGKPVADSMVTLYKNNKPIGSWHPLAGSMSQQSASHYSLSFAINKDYSLHQKLPIILLQRFVPTHVLSWLAQDKQLMSELTQYLSGDLNYKGVLKEIVTKADSESVKQNLLTGPRTRFSTARAVPLIERLMQALRMMLEEGLLKLNQPGAHGWVFEDKLWFTSKRIADEVRNFIATRESPEGLPGQDKNDRIFDTWQEYGALVPTPDHKAVWLVNISLDDGWNQEMTVICFPLSKLFKHSSLYPENMRGRISIVSQDNLIQTESNSSDENHITEPMKAHTEVPLQQPNEPHGNLSQEPSLDEQELIEAGAINPVIDAPVSIKKTSSALPPINAKKLAQSPKEENKVAESEFLDMHDSAAPIAKKKPPLASTLKPIAPAGQSSFVPSSSKSKKEPSEAALKFMRWVQEGLANGDLPYNRSDAMIHFVEDGMMLVSPLIFRKFAEHFGEAGDGKPSEKAGGAIGTGIQRQVTNAGWHKVTGANKSNIQKFIVAGHDGSGKKIISGVVILDPVRFVNPLPDINPSIVPFDKNLD